MVNENQVAEQQKQQHGPKMQYHHAELNTLNLPISDEQATAPAAVEDSNVLPFTRQAPKVGRNDLCPCGSGKKYKQCHGEIH